jgi:hypothetical protein
MDEADVTLPTICTNDVIPAPQTHEPPIGLTEGSLHLGWNYDIIESNVAAPSGDPRPFKYVEAVRTRGPLAVARILTENDRGAHFKRYILPRNTQARILIWLQQLTATSTVSTFQYEPRTNEAQLVVRGGPFCIESQERLEASYATYKPNSRFGHRYPDRSFARHFRIAQWQIVDATGAVVREDGNPMGTPFMDMNQDGYHIYLSFHD